ncbi:hypothetical protein [Cupriavidus necator]
MSRVDPLAALDDLDASPNEKASKPRSARSAVEKIAHDNGFLSREPRRTEPAVAERKQRRYTTGRNQQLNIKVTAQTHARFAAIVDEMGIPAGAVFEQAIDALEEIQRNR